MLFWKDLLAKLVSWGCEINPCDWCVANKMVNGKQCTVLWHVDDLKISHVDPAVVESLLDLLNGVCGKLSPLVTTRGKTHDCLGMTLDCTEDGEVKIAMKDYIEGMLAETPDDMDGEAAFYAVTLGRLPPPEMKRTQKGIGPLRFTARE
jgi:hypothetical protein